MDPEAELREDHAGAAVELPQQGTVVQRGLPVGGDQPQLGPKRRQSSHQSRRSGSSMISAHVDTRGGGGGGGGGGDELPASNEDGDPNPTNSDPTGPTNTAVGSGKHQGGYYCKGEPTVVRVFDTHVLTWVGVAIMCAWCATI